MKSVPAARYLGLLACLWVAVSLAACDSSKLPPTASPTPPVATPVPVKSPQGAFTSPLQADASRSPLATPATSALLNATTDVTGIALPGEIAFHSERAGNLDIWLVRPDGSELRQLTTDPETDVDPSWSPDGRQIVFASTRAEQDRYAIWVMDADGGNQRLLAQAAGYHLMGPVWSPEGSQIALYGNQDGDLDIYVMKTDGTGLENLTDDPANDFRPDWSPDGKRLVFVSDRAQGDNVYILDLASSQVITVTEGSYLNDLPKWSPDGKTILFTSNRGGQRGLYTVPAGGGEEPKPVLPLPQRDDSPAWAGDGRFILFSSQRTGDWELYALDRSEDRLYQFPPSPGFDRFPTWKP